MSDQKKFRISLWEVDTTPGVLGGWRGAQKAVVFDAVNIAVEEYANDTGSAYWTLENNHPQIAEFIPLSRHYEISRWSESRGRWEFVGAGILDNYSSTEYETTFQGIDYKSVLNQSYTPLSGMTTSNSRQINSQLGSGLDPLNTVFDLAVATATTALRYINTTALSITGPTISAYGNEIRQITEDEYIALGGTYSYDNDVPGLFQNIMWENTVDEYRTYWLTPQIDLSWTAVWNGATASTGFDPTTLQFRVYATPPADEDRGEPPLAKAGIIGDFVLDPPFQTSTIITNGTSLGSYNFSLFPEELEEAIRLLPDPAGLTPDGKAYFAGNADISRWRDPSLYNWSQCSPLKNGVTYGFQIYAAIRRTATAANIWYRSAAGTVMSSTDSTSSQYNLPYRFTLGQGTENATTKITRIFNNAITGSDSSYSRLRYSGLSVINSGSTATTHTTMSAAQPVLEHIGDICDLEMGAKTTGDKVIFGIKKPTNGATYDGDFQLNLAVSSAASTAMALRYPDTISSFSFDPGYSRVRNDVKVIPSTTYLSGSPGANPSGVSLIGASAVDQASITANGRIPSIVPRDGLLNAAAAQNEANRIINTSKIANTKNVSISAVVNGIDLWNGWDIGDSINVTIKRGLVNIDEPFVISGVRWFGETDGHERIELELVQGTAFGAQFSAPSGGTSATTSGR